MIDFSKSKLSFRNADALCADPMPCPVPQKTLPNDRNRCSFYLNIDTFLGAYETKLLMK